MYTASASEICRRIFWLTNKFPQYKLCFPCLDWVCQFSEKKLLEKLKNIGINYVIHDNCHGMSYGWMNNDYQIITNQYNNMTIHFGPEIVGKLSELPLGCISYAFSKKKIFPIEKVMENNQVINDEFFKKYDSVEFQENLVINLYSHKKIHKNKYKIINLDGPKIDDEEIERRIIELAIYFNKYKLIFCGIKIYGDHLEKISIGMPFEYDKNAHELKVNLDKVDNGSIVFTEETFKVNNKSVIQINIISQDHIYPIKNILNNANFYEAHNKKILQIDILRIIFPETILSGIPLVLTTTKIIKKRKYGENNEEYNIEETITKKRRISHGKY